jgi:hypothetical protein
VKGPAGHDPLPGLDMVGSVFHNLIMVIHLSKWTVIGLQKKSLYIPYIMVIPFSVCYVDDLRTAATQLGINSVQNAGFKCVPRQEVAPQTCIICILFEASWTPNTKQGTKAAFS